MSTTSKKLIDPTVLLSVLEFATMRNVRKVTVYNNIKNGKIKPVLIGPKGKHIFIDSSVYGDFKFGRWENV